MELILLELGFAQIATADKNAGCARAVCDAVHLWIPGHDRRHGKQVQGLNGAGGRAGEHERKFHSVAHSLELAGAAQGAHGYGHLGS
ncbi:hypothetical protein V500_04997, partial [Pseudogymnoascus sp. VKM F-4518 (FW-2643)]